MLLFPNCKINLGLHVVSKRDDGFHNLQTVFYPVALNEALEILVNRAEQKLQEAKFTGKIEYVSWHPSGLAVNGDAVDNTCIKAYRLLQQDFTLAPVHIYLHKKIPMGAGLGGGSADGAFTLLLLNRLFNLHLTEEQLIGYALQLGSDCPFFILNKPAFATGRGELLQPVPLDLSAYKIVLINPGIHINTGWAFSQLQPAEPEISLLEMIQQPVTAWKSAMQNDFEKPVFEKYPEIKKLKMQLYKAGAVYASMSGSGSTVYGIFPKNQPVSLKVPQKFFYCELPL